MDVDADADAPAAAASDADDAAAQSDASAAAAEGASALDADDAAPGGGPRLLGPERRAFQRHEEALMRRFPMERLEATGLLRVVVTVPKVGLAITRASRGGVEDKELGRLSAGFAKLAANLLDRSAEEDLKKVEAFCAADPTLRLHAKDGPSALQLFNIVFADREASACLLGLMSRIAHPMEALRSVGGAGDVDDNAPGALGGGGGAGTGAPNAALRARRGAAAQVLIDPDVARVQPLALLPVPAGAPRSVAAPVANPTGQFCCVSAASHALCNPAMLRFLGAHAPACAADTAGRAAGGRPCYACAFDNFFEHSRRTVGALADSPLLRHVLAAKGLSERKQHDSAEILLFVLNQFVNDSDLWQRRQWNPPSNDAALPRPPCVGFITTSRVCACRAHHGIVIERELMLKVAARKPSGRRAPPLEFEELLLGYFQPRVVDDPGNLIDCDVAGCSRRFAEQASFFLLPEVLYVELKRGEHGASGRMARHAHRIDVGDSVDLTHLVPLTEEELERLCDGRFVYDVVTVIFKEGGVLGGHYVSATRELDAAALGGGAAPAAAAAPPAAPAFNFFDDGNPPERTTLSTTMDENSRNTYVVALVARDHALHEHVLGQRRQMNDAQRREHALNVTAGVGLDAASVGGGGDGDGASDGGGGASDDDGGGGGGGGDDDDVDASDGAGGGGGGAEAVDSDGNESSGSAASSSSESSSTSACESPPARAGKRRAPPAPPTPPRPARQVEEDEEAGFVRRRKRPKNSGRRRPVRPVQPPPRPEGSDEDS